MHIPNFTKANTLVHPYVKYFINGAVSVWGDENVIDRVAESDPVFVPPHFFDLKISHLQNAGNKNRINSPIRVAA
jgi:hypothetical protein